MMLFYQLYFSLIIFILLSLFEPIFKIQIMTFYIFYLLRLLSVESDLFKERTVNRGV